MGMDVKSRPESQLRRVRFANSLLILSPTDCIGAGCFGRPRWVEIQHCSSPDWAGRAVGAAKAMLARACVLSLPVNLVIA